MNFYTYFRVLLFFCAITISAQEKYFRENDIVLEKSTNKMGKIHLTKLKYTHKNIMALERKTPYRIIMTYTSDVSRFGFPKEAVTEVEYYNINYNGVALLPKGKLIQIYDKQANKFDTYKSVGKGYMVSNGNNWGIVNFDGRLIIPPSYATIKEGKGGYEVFNGNNWGVVDFDGKLTIPPYYETVETQTNNITIVEEKSGKGGFINTKNGKIINMYDSFRLRDKHSSTRTYIVRKGTKWGLVDDNAIEIVPPKYEEFYVSDNYIFAKTGGTHYVIDKKGKIMFSGVFKSIQEYCGGNFIVEQNKTFSIYSKEGKPLTSDTYFRIESDGQAFISEGDIIKTGCLDCQGKEILPIRYDAKYVNNCSEQRITEISIEEGTFTGYASHKFPNGDFYTGNFVNGEPSGRGEMKLKDGRTYIGNWKNGVYNGSGKLIFPDGNSYVEGTFVNGKAEGYGTFRYCNRGQSIGCRLMKGNFRNGMPFGEFSYEQGTWLTGYNTGTIYFDENGKSTLNLTERDFLSNAGSSSSSSRNNTSSQPKEKEPTNADCEAKYRSEFYKIKSRVKSKFSQKISNEKTKYEVEVPSPKGGTLHFSAIQLTNSFGTFWREENYYGVPVGNVMYKTLDDLIYAKYIYEACQFYTENNRTTY